MYCIDTSVLIQANEQLAPMDVNPSFWSKFEKLVRDGRAISPDEVLREIEKKSDQVHEWCKNLNGTCDTFFLPLEEEVQDASSEILAQFPKLVDDRQGKGQADPFVIGLAKIRRATVVTQEGRTGSNNRPKIPDVCAHYGIRCFNLVDLMRAERWRF
jgi:hypothetical protein